jgi:hypothetical protein
VNNCLPYKQYIFATQAIIDFDWNKTYFKTMHQSSSRKPQCAADKSVHPQDALICSGCLVVLQPVAHSHA